MIPRDFQSRAMADVGAQFRAGKRAALVVSPTGSGKTCMGAMMVERFVFSGKRVAWGAHRHELLEQAAKTLALFGLKVGLDGVGASAPVQLGTFQQWTARGVCPDADVLVADEAHHMGDRVGWQMIPKTYRERGARIIGLTATPARADGRALPDFDCIVVAAQIADLQRVGLLVPLRWRGPDAAMVRQLRDRRAIAQSPADAYLAECRRVDGANRCAVVFAPNMTAGEQYTREFHLAGIRATLVRGDMPPDERRIALAAHAEGRVDVLVNVAVLTEGWDNPRCDCVIVARGCESEALWIQMVGRGLRPFEAKLDCLLLDLQGLAHTLGRPDAAATYSLEGAGITLATSADVGDRLCKVCKAPLGKSLVCVGCGKDHTPPVPRALDLELTDWQEGWEAAKSQLAPSRVILALAGILHKQELARSKGKLWKPGAAEFRFQMIFRRRPYPNEMAAARNMVRAAQNFGATGDHA